MEITIPRSKGDQEGAGQAVGIPRGQRAETCPVRALERWLAVAPIGPHEPLFRKVSVVRARQGKGRGRVLREVAGDRVVPLAWPARQLRHSGLSHRRAG